MEKRPCRGSGFASKGLVTNARAAGNSAVEVTRVANQGALRARRLRCPFVIFVGFVRTKWAFPSLP